MITGDLVQDAGTSAVNATIAKQLEALGDEPYRRAHDLHRVVDLLDRSQAARVRTATRLVEQAWNERISDGPDWDRLAGAGDVLRTAHRCIVIQLAALAAGSNFYDLTAAMTYRRIVTPDRIADLVALQRHCLRAWLRWTGLRPEVVQADLDDIRGQVDEAVAVLDTLAGFGQGSFWAVRTVRASGHPREASQWGAAVVQRNVIGRAAREAAARLRRTLVS